MHRGEGAGIKEGEEKPGCQWFYIKKLAVGWVFPIK